MYIAYYDALRDAWGVAEEGQPAFVWFIDPKKGKRDAEDYIDYLNGVDYLSEDTTPTSNDDDLLYDIGSHLAYALETLMDYLQTPRHGA